MQHAPLVQPREEQLAAEAVVVAGAVTGDREAEDAVEEDGILHRPGVGVALRLERDRLTEGREVAAQLLERVEEVRHPLLDHERVEGQVPVHVGAVVDEVPHDEGALGELLVRDEAGGVRRQGQARHRGRLGDDATEPGRLTVGEDAAPREGRDLAHRDGLGEEHGGVACRSRR